MPGQKDRATNQQASDQNIHCDQGSKKPLIKIIGFSFVKNLIPI